MYNVQYKMNWPEFYAAWDEWEWVLAELDKIDFLER